MTLLELLRQELPKRGGWPEGVTHICQDEDKYIGGHTSKPIKESACDWGNEGYVGGSGEYSEILADDYATAIVTREQYEATGWDGKNLPPVGCECERSWCGDKWLACKILFISDETVVVKLATREAAYGRSEVSFRPLRTEADRAIDEMVQLSGVSTGAAKILYDAGYRK